MAEKIVVFQGDSITDCSRNYAETDANTGMGHGYAELVTAKLLATYPEQNIKCFNRGVSGNRVVDLYARWKIDCINLNPDVLSILVGVNDTWHEFARANGVEIDRYDMFYRMLLDWVLDACPEIKIIMFEPFVLPCGVVEPAWVTEIDQRREVAAKIAAEYNTEYILTQSIFNQAAGKLNNNEYYLRDGVHPTLAGHQLLADAWLQAAGKFF